MKMVVIRTLIISMLTLSVCAKDTQEHDHTLMEQDLPPVPMLSTEAQLQDFVRKHPKAVIEFFNPECPICKMFKQSGIFAGAMQDMPQIGFAMVSLTEGRDLHKKYKPTGYPTFILFENGKALREFTGYMSPKVSFENNINKLFSMPVDEKLQARIAGKPETK